MVVEGASDEIIAYHNAGQALVQSSNTKRIGGYATYSGHTVIGRRVVNEDKHYTSMIMDELAFWNRDLDQDEIWDIYQWGTPVGSGSD